MKLSILFLFILSALLIGCGSKEESATTPTTVPSKAVSLGSKQDGDHFGITLTSEPKDLKVGKTKFVAAIIHHGQPTEAANVKLSLSMTSMDMAGPEVELKHVGGGKYEGEADLAMGGDWQAKVTVEQEGHPGEAVFSFTVSQ